MAGVMSESGPPGHRGEFFTLVEVLRMFRAGPLASDPSDRALARAAGVSPTTIGKWLQGKQFPQEIGKILVMVRMVQTAAVHRGVAIPGSAPPGLLDEDRWRAAYQQEARRRAGVVSGGVEQAQAVWALAGPRVRVREADPRLLGVHAAIRVPGTPDEAPPEYVPRDVDAAEFGVRAKVEAAARRGGFVLLVGGSSVGKTRTAVEAVKALLPDWQLVHPPGPAEVAALAQAPPPQTVVWLDELQRYLDGERGLTGAVVRALLNTPSPVVIISTLWPDRYVAYTTMPTADGADPRAREREVLELAAVIRISAEFSLAEKDRARAAAARDPRLAAAVKAAGYGLTQTLAAAPQLVARWQDAQEADPYAWAVLTAALDVARLGARAPLVVGLLRAAAPGYCTSTQQAEAPDNWFEQALAYATQKLHGAATALAPAGTGMGRVAGYTAADYLIQHATRARRSARPPASTWDAILSHVRDPADAARLAYSAERRLLYRYAIPLYRHAANAGDGAAAWGLANLLAERGDLDEAEQILRVRTKAGDWDSSARLAGLLAERGDLDGAAQIVRAQIEAGGRPDGLRWRADAGDVHAAVLLAERGDLDGLRSRADAGDVYAAVLLAERGDLDGLRSRANAGDVSAAIVLAVLLAERGDLDGLRSRANAGDLHAAARLADLLAQRGDLDGLRSRVNAGDLSVAGVRLADLLIKQGQAEKAERLRRFGLNPDGSIACA